MSLPVEIRRYTSVDAYKVDATAMAAAGWIVVAQSEATGGMSGAWVGVVLAATNRRKELVVTYRPTVAAAQA